MLFFVLRAAGVIFLKPRKNLGKVVVFAHQELLRTASARACESMKKLGKIDRWSLQNPPRSVLDPSKIDRGALQDAKKTDQKRERTQQERKMRLGSAQERKIAPTWRQHIVRLNRRRDGRASP